MVIYYYMVKLQISYLLVILIVLFVSQNQVSFQKYAILDTYSSHN